MFTNILIPALAVGATGLAFGALLGFASIVFKVEKDERIDGRHVTSLSDGPPRQYQDHYRETFVAG